MGTSDSPEPERYTAVQVTLRGAENQVRTIWVDTRRSLKQGVTIELKDEPGVRWQVERIYDIEREVLIYELPDIMICY